MRRGLGWGRPLTTIGKMTTCSWVCLLAVWAHFSGWSTLWTASHHLFSPTSTACCTASTTTCRATPFTASKGMDWTARGWILATETATGKSTTGPRRWSASPPTQEKSPSTSSCNCRGWKASWRERPVSTATPTGSSFGALTTRATAVLWPWTAKVPPSHPTFPLNWPPTKT